MNFRLFPYLVHRRFSEDPCPRESVPSHQQIVRYVEGFVVSFGPRQC